MDDRRLLIVNADDFGLSPEANAAILRMHREGIVTSATLMANMPGSGDAIELARGCPDLALGLHVNLTDGAPLCEPAKLGALVTSCGLLPGLAWLMGRAWVSGGAMRREIAAQAERALAAGVRITHLDSHKHVHVHPKVLAAVIAAAKEYGIGAVRVPIESRGCRTGVAWDWKMRSALVSVNALRVRRAALRAGLAVTDHFIGTARTCNWSAEAMAAAISGLKPGVTELMVHPDDAEVMVSGEVKSAVEPARARLISYAELARTSEL
jgi:chitin disaccharide deacetylase